MRVFAGLVTVCLILMLQVRADSERWPLDAKEAARQQADAAKALHLPLHVTVELGGAAPLKMVLIPAGTFMMGSPEAETTGKPLGPRPNEWPQHKVIISRPFYLSVYKTTQKQFEQILATNPSKFREENNPVDAVTWDDAAAFCEKASAKTGKALHLPTEAQWEYAVRAGSATSYSFGTDESQLPDYSWFHDSAKGMTHPVGQKRPNAWGLFDVHGLVWEYCSDYYADSYKASDSTDPAGPGSGVTHTARGGTYGSRPMFVRSAIRMASPAADAGKDLLSRFGFRVAMDLPTANTAYVRP
jgi:formylglycine-generating enzyme required for sulfatase activity